MDQQDGLRVGDLERDEVTRVLHDAFAQGRITRGELDERLDAALSARTTGDLRRITADLPGAGMRGAYDPPPQWRERRGDPAPWGWHLAEARQRAPRIRGRRGSPPIVFVVPALALAGALAMYGAWPLFAALRLLFLAWLAAVVIGIVRHRHGHRHRHWHGHRYGHWHGHWPGHPGRRWYGHWQRG